jgi:transmembrane sensor
MFRVAHNQQRPFLVETELATARAVGTSFAVSRETADETKVTVEEGVVAVTGPPKQALSGQSTMLRAGDEVSVTLAGASARHINPQTALAWVNGNVVLQNRTIEEAVHDFNRRSSTQIQVLDPTLKRRTVSGIFSAADPNSFAGYLEKQGDVTVEREGSNTLLLKPYAEGVDKGSGKQQER